MMVNSGVILYCVKVAMMVVILFIYYYYFITFLALTM